LILVSLIRVISLLLLRGSGKMNSSRTNLHQQHAI